ncbi:MAG: TetR/AcrR family transcriptional regulator [Pannonibacter indicus]
MPRISPEKLEERRQQIRAAAARCFARKGIQATTMREIFAEAGLSAGAVYNYYRTKDDLIADGITASTAESADAITAAAEVLSFDEVIGQFLADLKAAASDGRARATPMIHAEVAVRPDLLKMFQEGRSRIRDALRDQLARTRPDLSPQETATLAGFVLAFYQGLVSEAALGSLPDLEAMHGIIRLVLSQYGKAPDAPRSPHLSPEG